MLNNSPPQNLALPINPQKILRIFFGGVEILM